MSDPATGGLCSLCQCVCGKSAANRAFFRVGLGILPSIKSQTIFFDEQHITSSGGSQFNPTRVKADTSSSTQLNVLYNIWHGFSVRSLWPRVLWQTVMLWLVNRVMAVVVVSWSNMCVTGRRLRDNDAVILWQSRESGVGPGKTQPS